ncbi:hypothetical protein IU486_01620 [Streptomyces gardneri]|nr:hypothetical protein [Streptomyces gardneri]
MAGWREHAPTPASASAPDAFRLSVAARLGSDLGGTVTLEHAFAGQPQRAKDIAVGVDSTAATPAHARRG